MFARLATLIVGLGMFALAGCLSPVQREVNALVCSRAGQEMDLATPDFLVTPKEAKPRPPVDPTKPQNLLQRLELPESVPGSEAPKLILPKDFEKRPAAEREAMLDRFFKSQLEVGSDPRPVPGPDGQPLSLADLQKMAAAHSPLLRQAASDIKSAEGAVVQAAVYTNPTLGYTTTPISFTSGNTLGPGISQTIVTMGKRTLAEAAAKKELANAQLAYRRAEFDLMATVRVNYFAVLVSQEGMRVNRGLMELTDETYKVMLLRLKAGQVAPYEPAQVGVFAGQARMAYLASRNSYLQSWKTLAASMGLTAMPPTELSGSVTKELPRFEFEKALAHVLQNHTDALTALNRVDKARLNLRLSEVNAVPDITVGAVVLHDNSAPGPPRFVPNFVGSVPLPFFDRNQGNIRSAQGGLMHALEEPHRVQNALTASFVDAYRRLEESRQNLMLYRKQILPLQAQAFRASVERHYGVGAAALSLGDLITAEQNLVVVIAAYLSTLGSYWQAVADTASLLQTDDVYQMASEVDRAPDPDLLELLKLPCCHACSDPQNCLPGAGRTPQVDRQASSPNRNSVQGEPILGAPTLLAPQSSGEATKGGAR